MSYTPNNWKPGDVLTAAKMNKLEAAVAQGGGGGVLKLNGGESNGTLTLDASYNDIVAAVEAGKDIIAVFPETERIPYTTIMHIAGYQKTIIDGTYVFHVQFYDAIEGEITPFSSTTADALLASSPAV